MRMVVLLALCGCVAREVPGGPGAPADLSTRPPREFGSSTTGGGGGGGGPWPVARSNHALAYDPDRGKVVLFAGTNAERLGDLWEWDGARWTERTAAAGAAWPQPHYGHAMVYDPVRKRMFVFGGGTEFGGVVREGWEWDGVAGIWTLRNPAVAPSARSAVTMAWDAARGRAVLFGGFESDNFNGPRQDTWEWDGDRWIDRTPATLPSSWPSARSSHSLVYDAKRGRVVMFGGFNNKPGGWSRDLWEWDGSAWINRTPSSIPAAWPSARGNHGVAWDATRSRMVIFGGAPDGPQELWEWDGSAWSQPTAASGAWPGDLISHAMAWDAARSVTVSFGGCCSLNDLWEWDGERWSLRN